MVRLKNITLGIAISLVLSGCSTVSTKTSDEYQPNSLSSEQIVGFQNLAKESSKKDLFSNVAFNEETSLLTITIKALPGKRFLRKKMESHYIDAICSSETPFFKMVRETGVGLQYKFIDSRTKQKFGPWNVGICG